MTERELEYNAEVARIGDMSYVRERLPGSDGHFGEWRVQTGSSLVACGRDEHKLIEVLLAERKAAADRAAALIAAVNKAMDERLTYLQAQITHAEGRIVSTTRYNARFGNAGSARNQLDTVMHECTVALAQMEGARAMRSDVLIDLAKITGTAVDGGTPK